MEAKYPDRVVNNQYFDLRKRLIGISKISRLLVEEQMSENLVIPRDHQETYLEFILPTIYKNYGIEEKKAKLIGQIIDDLCMEEITVFVANLSSLPEFSRSASIRIAFEFFGISVEEYDTSHYRRYFDRYVRHITGSEYHFYRKKFTLFIKTYLQTTNSQTEKSILHGNQPDKRNRRAS